MGLLRKLAELVVEFPDQQPASKEAKGSGDDVVAAIEEIRRGLERDIAPDYTKEETEQVSIRTAQPELADQRMTGELDSGSSAQIRMPAVLSVGEIYKRAGIKSDASGFDLAKLEELLADPEIADLPLEIRARSVKASLKAMGKELRDIIEEAAKRDQALEDYLVYLDHRVQQVEEQVAAANVALKHEIDSFVAAKTAAIENNKEMMLDAKAALADFRRSKSTEEQRLFSVVSPFVLPGENPVVVSERDQADRDKKV
jgi:hypothetical protein